LVVSRFPTPFLCFHIHSGFVPSILVARTAVLAVRGPSERSRKSRRPQNQRSALPDCTNSGGRSSATIRARWAVKSHFLSFVWRFWCIIWVRFAHFVLLTSFVFNNFLASFPLFCICRFRSSTELRPNLAHFVGSGDRLIRIGYSLSVCSRFVKQKARGGLSNVAAGLPRHPKRAA